MSELFGLIGVIIGFLLSLLGSHYKDHKRLKAIHLALNNELKSIQSQIPQKIDIINQICSNLDKGNFLSGVSVKFIRNIYLSYISELTIYLTEKERNCLHVIYEKSINADNILHNFEDRLREDYNNKMFSNPFKVHKIILEDIRKNLETVNVLISSFLEKKPTDVFYIDKIKP